MDTKNIKSRVLNFISPEDFLKVKDKIKFVPKDHTEEIYSELKDMAKRCGKLVEVDETVSIKADDIVKVKLISENEKFNREVSIVVGTNFFSEELEKQLIGMHLNMHKKVLLENSEVEVIVLSVQVKIIPEISDEIVFKATDGKFKTKQEFIDNSISEMKLLDVYNEVYLYHFGKLKKEYLSMMHLEIDDEEANEYADYLVDSMQSFCKQENLTMEHLCIDYLGKELNDGDDAVKVIHNWAKGEFSNFVVAYKYCELKNIILSDEDYNEKINDVVNEQGISKELAEKTFTKTDYYYNTRTAMLDRDFGNSIANYLIEIESDN